MANRTIAVALAVAIATGCGSAGDDESTATVGDDRPQLRSELWGETFRSTAITESGDPRPLVPGTRLAVSFMRTGGRQDIGWDAGCNDAGSRVQIDGGRLRLARIATTLMGCPPDLARQDGWLSEFFESDPHWHLTGDRLLLTSRGTVIELE